MSKDMAPQVVKEASNCVQKADPLNFKTPDSTLPSTRTRILRDFTITTDSYISLCSRVYAACCSISPEFADRIPESAFQYYAVLLLWKRFAELLPRSEKIGSDFFSKLQQLCSSYNVPVPLQTYLRGIGNFRDPDGCDRRFLLPVFPISEEISGVPYTFGRVNAETHFLYEALPAPGISALRMQADIRYTKDAREKNLVWDLPDGLCPNIQESEIKSIKPTINLLGWAPAQRLTHSQLKLFETCKINENFMPYNYKTDGQSVYNLLNNIHSYLGRCKSLQNSCYVNFAIVSGHSVTGSLVQGLTVVKHDDSHKFERSTMYCEGNLSVCSPYKSNDTLNKGAVISAYRMAKEPIGNRHCWSCYDFNEYKSVPESWILTRNTIYTYGSIDRLNETVYTTGYISKRVLQSECIQHTMLPTMTNWNLLY